MNIGTLDTAWAEAMEMAAQTMDAAGRPWVLDPVGVGATQFRRDVCARLMALRPTVIRGNASEILALAGLGGAGRGADSADPVAAAEASARDLATRCGAVVAVSGPVDYVTDGVQGFRVANGDALMPRVTALGCSLNGVIAAFLVGHGRKPDGMSCRSAGNWRRRTSPEPASTSIRERLGRWRWLARRSRQICIMMRRRGSCA